jgi:hypothetical protein
MKSDSKAGGAGHWPRRAKTHWPLTLEAFERLLRWLSPDRDEAARKYEQIRTKMVRLFNWRGCHCPEELFDRTIDRVCRKIELGAYELRGDAIAFCYAVGRFILQEYWREVKLNPLPEDVPLLEIKDRERDERELEGLEDSLNRLSRCDRDLLVSYYQGEGRERIRKRKDLAAACGGPNALRIQVFRIRAKLRGSAAERALDEDENEKLNFSRRLSTPSPGHADLAGIAQDSDRQSKNSHNFLPEVQFTHSCAESLRITIGQTNSTQEGKSVEAIGLLVTLEARQGKEAEAEAFLKSAQPLALDEQGTMKWYAIKLGAGKFGIFDTFANEGGRNAHLCGEIAKALGARAVELLAAPPQIEKVEVLASTPLKG